MTLKSFLASGTASIIERMINAGAIAVFAVSVTVVATVSHSDEVMRGVASARMVEKFVNIYFHSFHVDLFIMYAKIKQQSITKAIPTKQLKKSH